MERGFHHVCSDLDLERRIVVYPGSEAYPLTADIAVMSLPAAGRAVLEAA